MSCFLVAKNAFKDAVGNAFLKVHREKKTQHLQRKKQKLNETKMQSQRFLVLLFLAASPNRFRADRSGDWHKSKSETKRPVLFHQHNLNRYTCHFSLSVSGTTLGHPGTAWRFSLVVGHHLLPDFPYLQLQAELVGEHVRVLHLELARGLVGRKKSSLLKELHH